MGPLVTVNGPVVPRHWLGRRWCTRRAGAGVKVERPQRRRGRTTLRPARSGAGWWSTQQWRRSGHRRALRVDHDGRLGRSVTRCAGSPCLIWVRGSRLTRRHDGRWGGPRRCARLLILFGTTARRGGDRGLPGASRGHQLMWASARTGRHRQAACSTGIDGGAQAASPSSRRVCWQRRASLRATESVGRLPPRRSRTAA